MKYINDFRIFESSDVCSMCDGSGKDSDYISVHTIAHRECSDCYGTGKLSAQKFKEELNRTIDDFKNELKDLCDKFIQDRNLGGFISSEVNQHSDEYDDIESIDLQIQIYGSTLSKQFLDEIADRYIDYKIKIDPYKNFYLIVTKPF